LPMVGKSLEESLEKNLKDIRLRINSAAIKSGREADSVTLLAVSKKQPSPKIQKLAELGQKDFGENYVQELLLRFELFPSLRWHYIGQLQRNKCKYIVGKVTLIHSVDRGELASEISKIAAKDNLTQDVLIQVNLGSEESKGGVEPHSAQQLVGEIREMKNIRVRGLMALPPLMDDPEDSRKFFRKLRIMRDELLPGGEISMGTSHDFEVAVEEGATIVRLGTSLFGNRE